MSSDRHSSVTRPMGEDGPALCRIGLGSEERTHSSGNWPDHLAFVRLIGGRWTLAVLAELGGGGRRYHEIHGALGSVAHKVLTETLRRAERDGLIVRRLDVDRIESATLYELTPLGQSLKDPLAAVTSWMDEQWSRVVDARRHWDRRVESEGDQLGRSSDTCR